MATKSKPPSKAAATAAKAAKKAPAKATPKATPAKKRDPREEEFDRSERAANNAAQRAEAARERAAQRGERAADRDAQRGDGAADRAAGRARAAAIDSANFAQTAASNANRMRMDEMKLAASLADRKQGGVSGTLTNANLQRGRNDTLTQQLQERAIKGDAGALQRLKQLQEAGLASGGADANLSAQLASRERMGNAEIAARAALQGNDLASRERMQGTDIAARDRDRTDRIASSERMQDKDIQLKRDMPRIQAESEDDLRRKAASRAVAAFNQLAKKRTVDTAVG